MNSRVGAMLLIATLALAAPDTVSGQPGTRRDPDRFGREGRGSRNPFKVSISQQPGLSGDSSLVHFYTGIPLSRLVFIRAGGVFQATYELSVFVLNEDEMVVATRIWNESVEMEHFAETRAAGERHTSYLALQLPPGEYKVVAHLVDLDNRDRLTVRKDLQIEELENDKLALGRPLLIPALTVGEIDMATLQPVSEGRIVNTSDTFFVLVTIRLADSEPVEAVLKYSVSSGKDVVLEHEVPIALEPGLSQHQQALPSGALTGRKYTLKVRLEGAGESVTQSMPILVEWLGFSGAIGDIDDAVDQTRYVARGKHMKAMRIAKGEEKKKAFLAFWDSLDPTPGTERNELMDEYYSRVAYANLHFETYQPGWQSDRGMVYIIYGPPDDIQHNPGRSNRQPFQVWRYFNKQWQFVFVDVNMFGDYRLMSPLYPTGVSR